MKEMNRRDRGRRGRRLIVLPLGPNDYVRYELRKDCEKRVRRKEERIEVNRRCVNSERPDRLIENGLRSFSAEKSSAR
jgi:hypothetical protein